MHEYTVEVDTQKYPSYGAHTMKPIWEEVTRLSSEVEFPAHAGNDPVANPLANLNIPGIS